MAALVLLWVAGAAYQAGAGDWRAAVSLAAVGAICTLAWMSGRLRRPYNGSEDERPFDWRRD